MKQKIISISFFIFLILSISISWRKATDGFRCHKILLKRSLSSNSPSKDISKILNQDFHYLSKGSQTYVFLSDDKKYVIKFIAYNKYKEPFRRNLLFHFNVLHFNVLEKYRKNRIFNRDRNFKNALSSYKIAYDKLKDETEIIYSNIEDKDNFLKKISIIDKTHQKHKIELSQSFFILQKKADILKPTLLFFIKNKNEKELKKIIKDYLKNSFQVVKKGVLNKDSSVKNGGYINKKFVEVDLGRFILIEDKKKAFESYIELYRKFFKENAPYMLSFFDKKQKKIKEEL